MSLTILSFDFIAKLKGHLPQINYCAIAGTVKTTPVVRKTSAPNTPRTDPRILGKISPTHTTSGDSRVYACKVCSADSCHKVLDARMVAHSLRISYWLP